MKNIEVKVNKNQMLITVDLSIELGISRSGKSTMIATTEGNTKVPGHEDVTIGLNVFKRTK